MVYRDEDSILGQIFEKSRFLVQHMSYLMCEAQFRVNLWRGIARENVKYTILVGGGRYGHVIYLGCEFCSKKYP